MIWLKNVKNKCAIWQLCQICSMEIVNTCVNENLLVSFFTDICSWYKQNLVFLATKFLLVCKSCVFVTTTIAWKVLAQLCFSTISIRCDSHDPKPSPFWLHRHIFANTFPNLQSFSEEIIPLTWPLANAVWKGNSFET